MHPVSFSPHSFSYDVYNGYDSQVFQKTHGSLDSVEANLLDKINYFKNQSQNIEETLELIFNIVDLICELYPDLSHKATNPSDWFQTELIDFEEHLLKFVSSQLITITAFRMLYLKCAIALEERIEFIQKLFHIHLSRYSLSEVLITIDEMKECISKRAVCITQLEWSSFLCDNLFILPAKDLLVDLERRYRGVLSESPLAKRFLEIKSYIGEYLSGFQEITETSVSELSGQERDLIKYFYTQFIEGKYLLKHFDRPFRNQILSLLEKSPFPLSKEDMKHLEEPDFLFKRLCSLHMSDLDTSLSNSEFKDIVEMFIQKIKLPSNLNELNCLQAQKSLQELAYFIGNECLKKKLKHSFELSPIETSFAACSIGSTSSLECEKAIEENTPYQESIHSTQWPKNTSLYYIYRLNRSSKNIFSFLNITKKLHRAIMQLHRLSPSDSMASICSKDQLDKREIEIISYFLEDKEIYETLSYAGFMEHSKILKECKYAITECEQLIYDLKTLINEKESIPSGSIVFSTLPNPTPPLFRSLMHGQFHGSRLSVMRQFLGEIGHAGIICRKAKKKRTTSADNFSKPYLCHLESSYKEIKLDFFSYTQFDFFRIKLEKLVLPHYLPGLTELAEENQLSVSAYLDQLFSTLIEHIFNFSSSFRHLHNDYLRMMLSPLSFSFNVTASSAPRLKYPLGIVQQNPQFCSEFIANILAIALRALNKILCKKLSNKMKGSSSSTSLSELKIVIIPLLDAYINFEALHPQRLYDHLKPYLEPQDRPLCVKRILKED